MEFVTEPGGLSILEVEQLEGSVRGPGCVMPSSDSGGTGDAMIEAVSYTHLTLPTIA